ncbi:MAG: GNAT family N-acetyltransferase [Chloroflexota bacterium]
MIEIQPITGRNWVEALALRVSADQDKFVPSVAISLAKAYIRPDGITYDPYGIYSFEHDALVGFYCYMYRPHDMRVVYIGGFLIDEKYQRQGFGVQAMQAFLARVQDESPESEGVYLTVHPENSAAENFYGRFGFAKTGLVIDGEDAMGLNFEYRPVVSE